MKHSHTVSYRKSQWANSAHSHEVDEGIKEEIVWRETENPSNVYIATTKGFIVI